MWQTSPFAQAQRPDRLCLVLALALAVVLLFPATILADSPPKQTTGDEPCATCHWSEASQWEQSPHAMNGVACEHCHGTYLEGHPQEGVMTLSVDASQCQECHTKATADWQVSLHAQSGINCINCHLSHSQTTRLSAERLCCSCHSDGSQGSCGGTAHRISGVTCVECHVSEAGLLAKSHDDGDPNTVPGHTFTVVPGQLCLDCHAAELHEPTPVLDDCVSKKQLAVMTEQTDNLTSQLEDAEGESGTWQILSIVMLGVGLGVGILMGVVFMLAFSYIMNRREAKS